MEENTKKTPDSKVYTLIGAMSGSSLDGLDLALVSFWQESTGWEFKLHDFECIPFQPDLKEKLATSMELSTLQTLALDRELGTWIGEQAREFFLRSPIQHRQPQALASHGHTVFHQPDQGLNLQIGCGQRMANASRLPVINDFRSADISLGGQGAPLVPIGDRELFSAYDYCLNLGGIANISFEKNGERMAFDICPFNQPLNYFAGKLGQAYDAEGEIAAAGSIDKALLSQLNALDYYQRQGAKSLGKEWIDEVFMPLIPAEIDPKDALATLSAHFVMQIAQVVLADLSVGENEDQRKRKLLITGGGAYHMHSIHMLKNLLDDMLIVEVPGRNLIEAKEAIVFAFLGLLRLLKKPNSLASVTGASKDACGGVVYLPQG